MGNKSCYSNTQRRSTNSNPPQHHRYHFLPEKTSENIQQKHLFGLFPPLYCNIEILTDDLDRQEECIICFEPFCQREIIARLECLCIYHKQCLDQWSQRKPCCPLHMDRMISTKKKMEFLYVYDEHEESEFSVT